MTETQRLLEQLRGGIDVEHILLVAGEEREGRFREERVVRLVARRSGETAYVAMMLVYAGRPPLYRPWVEVYAQVPTIEWPSGATVPFFDGAVERALLATIAQHLGPGGCVYVDCESDDETRLGMNWGIPEPLTRVGGLLYGMGFTWFKAWYYPEGLREGGQKLQAEKPVDATAAARHRARWAAEIQRFVERAAYLPKHPYIQNALTRARAWQNTAPPP